MTITEEMQRYFQSQPGRYVAEELSTKSPLHVAVSIEQANEGGGDGSAPRNHNNVGAYVWAVIDTAPGRRKAVAYAERSMAMKIAQTLNDNALQKAE